ncbi:hypothetical protein PLICRDRAFT_99653 [Plicaturopsis crispa FD-325 SS-3]|nr:hypothetical protein PLICRDRAFT_99653 [Plicaturopsis crispa FD-325 SS-3]
MSLVVDLLGHPDVPESLISHPVVYASLIHTWKNGRLLHSSESTSISERVLRRYDAVCSPRVLHSLELVIQLVYTGTLAHYVLYPPARPIITNGLTSNSPREILIIIYSFTLVMQRWSVSTIPFLLVLVSFLVCLPFSPFPEDNSFGALLLALALLILQFHLPHPPSPLFLFSLDRTLPLSTLLHQGLSATLAPVLGFFLPVVIATFFLLSISLRDLIVPVTQALTVDVAPMETRTALLTMLAVEALLSLWCLFILAAAFASLLPGSRPSNAWDRYSTSIGLDARRAFVRALALYGDGCYFPPPFNVVRLVFISLPSTFLHVAGSPRPLDAAKKLAWRIIVGPFAFLAAGIWLWGLRRP